MQSILNYNFTKLAIVSLLVIALIFGFAVRFSFAFSDYPPVSFCGDDRPSASWIYDNGTLIQVDNSSHGDYIFTQQMLRDGRLAFYHRSTNYLVAILIGRDVYRKAGYIFRVNSKSPESISSVYQTSLVDKGVHDDYQVYIFDTGFSVNHHFDSYGWAIYDSYDDALAHLDDIYNNNLNGPSFTKNVNVDAFIANTLISMGVTFNSAADALSIASAAWDYCTDDKNSSAGFDSWNVEYFASYCNAQSNNYENWYNGYRVSADVTRGLVTYIRNNIQLLSGLPSGVSSLNTDYMPQYHTGTGFNSSVSSESQFTFKPAQTYTYVNGEYITSEGVSNSQFLYSPVNVRGYLGSPSAPVVTIPSGNNQGGGTITDINGDKAYDIDINFPSLDWLADALSSLLDFFKKLLDTVSNLLSKIIDTLERLFGDAFESLSDFGQGIIDWITTLFNGLKTVGSKYIPNDLWSVVVVFISLNIGVGLIKFILRGH